MNTKDLDALTKLLDEKDSAISDVLRRNLTQMSAPEYAAVFSKFDRKNYPPLLLEAHSHRSKNHLTRLLEKPLPDLEESLVSIASWGRPDLSGINVGRELDRLAEGVKDRSSNARMIDGIRETLFDENGFQANALNYYDPDNSFITVVIESRLGIPISLACIFLLIARRVGAAINPIGASGHFLLSARIEGRERFIDCYDRARIIDREEALMLISTSELLEPFPVVSTREIIARTLRNLYAIYLIRENYDRTADVAEMLKKATDV